jgi:hypothetical protein
MRSNITLMKWMIANGYEDKRTLGRRIKAMEAWIAKPELLKADAGAEYAAVIEIDLADVKEPIVACPNDPDDVKLLSEVAGAKIDEVFIGSCMTNIGHFRAAGKVLEGKSDIPTRLWVAPPTKMDADDPQRGRLLRHPRQVRRAHGNARLLAVHGQPGADPEGQHGDVDLDPQLPEPPRHRHLRLPRLRRTGLDLRAAGQDPDRRRVHGAGEGGERQGCRCLSLHELRPDCKEFRDVADTVTV